MMANRCSIVVICLTLLGSGQTLTAHVGSQEPGRDPAPSWPASRGSDEVYVGERLPWVDEMEQHLLALG